MCKAKPQKKAPVAGPSPQAATDRFFLRLAPYTHAHSFFVETPSQKHLQAGWKTRSPGNQAHRASTWNASRHRGMPRAPRKGGVRLGGAQIMKKQNGWKAKQLTVAKAICRRSQGATRRLWSHRSGEGNVVCEKKTTPRWLGGDPDASSMT